MVVLVVFCWCECGCCQERQTPPLTASREEGREGRERNENIDRERETSNCRRLNILVKRGVREEREREIIPACKAAKHVCAPHKRYETLVHTHRQLCAPARG